jgi:hypothetical protein
MEVIAERQLVLRKGDGDIDVTVKIGRPELDSSGENLAMHGVDSMQALQLTIATLDVELEVGARKHAGTLYHYDEPFTSMLENSGLEVRRT